MGKTGRPNPRRGSKRPTSRRRRHRSHPHTLPRHGADVESAPSDAWLTAQLEEDASHGNGAVDTCDAPSPHSSSPARVQA